MEFRVARQLDAGQRRVALDDVQLAARWVLGAAVDEFIDRVVDVQRGRELFLHVDAHIFGRLAAALIDENLRTDFIRALRVLGEIDLQRMLEKIGHRLGDEGVGDGLLRLVFIRRLRGKGVGHQHERILDVREGDAAFVFGIFPVVLQIAVDGPDERAARGLVRRAAMLQKGRIVIILDHAHVVGKAERELHLQLIALFVLAVLPLPLGGILDGFGQIVDADLLGDVIDDPVGVQKLLRGIAAVRLLPVEDEGQPVVDDGLPLEDFTNVLARDGDVGEHLQIGLPGRDGAGLFRRAGFLFQLRDRLALAKVYGILCAAGICGDVHKLRGALRRAGAQPVGAERILIHSRGGIVVFPAGVQLAVDQLPVIALFLFVPVQRHAAAEILHGDGAVEAEGDVDDLAEALARLVNAVGKDLEKRVLAALQPVRAEDDRWALAHTVGALQRADDALVVEYVFGHRWFDLPFPNSFFVYGL